MFKSEVELARGNRAKTKVLEILGNNPKVAEVGISADKDGNAEVVVFVRESMQGPRPVLPKTVASVPVSFRKFDGLVKTKIEAGFYRSNRQKMMIDSKKIINHLAAKFGKKVSYGIPLSFKMTDSITVVVLPHVSESGDSYRLEVKALQGPGLMPPFVADMTVDQMSPASATSDFIKKCEAGLADLNAAIYHQPRA